MNPFHSQGHSDGLTVSANGPQGSERSPVPGALNDSRFFTLHYTGKVPLKSVTFFGETASPTAPGTRNPPRSDGIVFDTRAFAPTGEDFTGVGFPFTVGDTSGGLASGSVHASFAVPGGGLAVPGQYRHMTVHFGDGLKRDQTVKFGVDRDLASSPYGDVSEGNGADELGGATFIPQRRVVRAGMRFTAVRADGTKIHGVINNRVGHGYSKVDGFGPIDAQLAVFGN